LPLFDKTGFEFLAKYRVHPFRIDTEYAQPAVASGLNGQVNPVAAEDGVEQPT
jgi:hypothetical protein